MAVEELWQEKVGFLLLGWALGTIGPIVTGIVTKRRETERVKKALQIELRELRYRFAAVVYMVQTRLGSLNRETIEWLHIVTAQYEGLHRNNSMHDTLSRLSNLSDEHFEALVRIGASQPEMALAMRTYTAPLLEEKLGHLSSFKVELQAQLLEVRASLLMFNEEVEQSRFYFELTFDNSITGPARARVEENLRGTYANAARRAKIIADQIGRISW